MVRKMPSCFSICWLMSPRPCGPPAPEREHCAREVTGSPGLGSTRGQKIRPGIDAPDPADAVARGDARKLSSIPGVGKKTAGRICLELRDKLDVSGVAKG